MGRRKNEDNDNGLLIWGIIFCFTGFLSWLGAIFIGIYMVKHVRNALGGIAYENLQSQIKAENKEPKVIVAEKVENVKPNNLYKENVTTNIKKTTGGAEYTNQEILDKLDYYAQNDCTSKEEILKKIEVLNKMLKCMETKVEKDTLKADIKEITKTVDKILKTLSKNHSKIKEINNFTTYYLPVTLRILIKYDEIENLDLQTSNSQDFMNTVEEKVSMIKGAFNKQLESLFINDFDDVEAELNVLETMLKTDGYTDIDEFNIRKNKN